MANNHVTAEGELYYPKLFPQNKEVSEYTTKTEGSYNTVFIPVMRSLTSSWMQGILKKQWVIQ